MRLNIKWSKQKKIVENSICESLRKRIRINLTHYRAIHEPESRFWITYDGEEIFSISKMEWLNEWDKIKKEYRENNRTEDECAYAENVMQNNGNYYIDDIQDVVRQNIALCNCIPKSNYNYNTNNYLVVICFFTKQIITITKLLMT